ncbi:MAG: enoyl-CoA hydratase-related protein [Armatimonadota bacterium]|nr:enoyl-CoA hydratase-related protein [Armatimonadota bacterium]MDR7451931.1 enoyl-CoA hydratase-related protein [Armatimonadota bacterium]MDR7466613.1 enoyl-CoA hydratase-related protein [Armatimonadota bacterium]MDR7492913.1 enoyl-CoA hydratase-related protein [Armatimonadota bacterium]MDR7500310.1 enoyl-CoA hydratase-related protein [Armatimonadota bacterium]
MDPFTLIRYEKRPPVAQVTINRPEVLNALNLTTLRELSRAFEDAAWDDAVAVLVLTGAGDRAFCTGADLDEQEQFVARPRDYWKWMGAFIEAQERLQDIGKPTIARLNGMVVGGGNEFHIACDLSVAAADVVIRQVGPARGSVPAAGATQWLPLIVGDRRAREILFLCEEIPAAQALAWGLVNQVVPRRDLDAAVETLARKLVEKLPEVTRYTKQQLNFWRDLSWHLTVGHAREWLTLHAGAPETQEGIEAFHEKRPVDYAGIRRRLAAGESTEFAWGPPVAACPRCGAKRLPRGFAYCGNCGTKLRG